MNSSERVWPTRKVGFRRAFMCVLLSGYLVAQAQTPAPTEYAVKAAFLYNFGKFVDWPAAARAADSFAICVLGEDPFGPELDRMIEGKFVGSKKLVVHRLGRVEEAAKCQILFVSSSENGRLERILTTLHGWSVLTVGDTKGFAQRGVMINFQLDGSKVRFEINLDAAEQEGFTVSSQLLKLAKVIRERFSPGM